MRRPEEDTSYLAEYAWENAREKDLHDRRVATVSVRPSEAVPFVNFMEDIFKQEEQIASNYGGHTQINVNNQLEMGRKALAKIKKCLKPENKAIEVPVEISGAEIYALERFLLEGPIAQKGAVAILDRIKPTAFLDKLGNDYINNPDKRMTPNKFGFVRKMFQRKK